MYLLLGLCKKILDDDAFKVHKNEILLKNDDKKEIDNIYSNTLYDDIFNFKIDGIKIGEHVYSSTLRFFARGDLKERYSEEIVKNVIFMQHYFTFFI